jgi:restriction system protein
VADALSRGGIRSRHETLCGVSIPTYDRMIEPLLRFLAEQTRPVATRDVYAALADRVGLSEAERQELLPSQAQLVYQNRISWAHDRLKRAELSHSPRRGLWQLTGEGLRFHAEHPRTLSDADLELITDPGSARGPTIPPIIGPQFTTPDERIALALAELRESTAKNLLERILGSTPEFFEHLVLQLLHALGYGTSLEDLQHVGKTGDGGIDGVISLDRLGLEKVYVQAKRWQNNVGRPEVQGFFGALAGRRATKGVIITTAGYTADAREFAEHMSDKIVLIDGTRLTQLMMDCGVGVSHKAVQLPRLDSDFFDDS